LAQQLAGLPDGLQVFCLLVGKYYRLMRQLPPVSETRRPGPPVRAGEWSLPGFVAVPDENCRACSAGRVRAPAPRWSAVVSSDGFCLCS
jgi:hypothetical protein